MIIDTTYTVYGTPDEIRAFEAKLSSIALGELRQTSFEIGRAGAKAVYRAVLRAEKGE